MSFFTIWFLIGLIVLIGVGCVDIIKKDSPYIKDIPWIILFFFILWPLGLILYAFYIFSKLFEKHKSKFDKFLNKKLW